MDPTIIFQTLPAKPVTPAALSAPKTQPIANHASTRATSSLSSSPTTPLVFRIVLMGYSKTPPTTFASPATPSACSAIPTTPSVRNALPIWPASTSFLPQPRLVSMCVPTASSRTTSATSVSLATHSAPWATSTPLSAKSAQRAGRTRPFCWWIARSAWGSAQWECTATGQTTGATFAMRSAPHALRTPHTVRAARQQWEPLKPFFFQRAHNVCHHALICTFRIQLIIFVMPVIKNARFVILMRPTARNAHRQANSNHSC